jgi:hypothetical protein
MHLPRRRAQKSMAKCVYSPWLAIRLATWLLFLCFPLRHALCKFIQYTFCALCGLYYMYMVWGELCTRRLMYKHSRCKCEINERATQYTHICMYAVWCKIGKDGLRSQQHVKLWNRRLLRFSHIFNFMKCPFHQHAAPAPFMAASSLFKTSICLSTVFILCFFQFRASLYSVKLYAPHKAKI